MGSESSSKSKTYISINERGEPDKSGRAALDKAITFHAGCYIPEMYKDGMPDGFVAKMLDALRQSFSKRCLPKKYATDRIKAVWKEWTSPPSAAQPSICRGDSMKYLDYLEALMDDIYLFKTRITVDEWGEFECKEDRKALVKTTNFQVRRFIPIIYKDSREVPNAFIERVMDALEENFNFNHIPDDCYITDIVKDSWRRHKNELREKYIKDRDPAVVKELSPSPFVTNEDWAQFVDMCTSSEYKAMCARNIKNRKDKVVTTNNRPNSTGISPGILTLAKKKNRNCDADLEMTEQDIISQHKTKKQKTVHSPDTTSAFQLGSNLSSRVFAGSSIQPCLTHQLDVGKQCDLLAWGSEVVACGVVVDVFPALVGHAAHRYEGVYQIAIKKVIISGSLLYIPFGPNKTIGDVGAKGIVVWPRCFLNIHH